MIDESAGKQPSDVNALLERIDAAWRQLMTAIDGVPDERLADPGVAGDWSLKDLFGHLAFWDEHALTEIDRSLAGMPRADSDWQELNETDHAGRRERTAQEQRVAMHQAHAALTERLRGIANIDAGKVDTGIRADTYEHYDEHRAGIEQWRQAAGI